MLLGSMIRTRSCQLPVCGWHVLTTSGLQVIFYFRLFYCWSLPSVISSAYAECFEGVEDMMNHIKEWNTEEYHARQLEMQACFMLKQSQYWFAECKEGAGDGVDGLVNFVHCARNTVS